MANNDRKQDESACLEHEIEAARAAIARVRGEIVHDLTGAAQPTAWAEQYPLPSLAAAFVGGLAAASVVKPIVTHAKQPEHQNGYYPAGYQPVAIQPEHHEKSSLLTKALRPVGDAVMTALKSVLVAAISAKTAQATTDPTAGGNDASHATAGAGAAAAAATV